MYDQAKNRILNYLMPEPLVDISLSGEYFRHQLRILATVYRILQIVRGGKVLRMDKVLQIRWKTFTVCSPRSKCAHVRMRFH